MAERRILITGGSGFIGRAVIHRIAAEGTRIIVPSRNPAQASALTAVAGVELVSADIHDPATLDQLTQDVHAVINLVGVLQSRPGSPWGPDFERAHVALPARLATACQHHGVARLIHISALGASPDGPSAYQRSKAAGEAAIRAISPPPAWTILRPSVVFGPEDRFLNLFAQLTRWFPALPLAGAHARFQPVHVGDVAEVIARCLDEPQAEGQTYELAGPKVYTLAELVRYVCQLTGRRRLIFPLPGPLALLQGFAMEMLPKPPISRDNVRSMQRDNIASGAPLPFGLTPAALESIVPGYLTGSSR